MINRLFLIVAASFVLSGCSSEAPANDRENGDPDNGEEQVSPQENKNAFVMGATWITSNMKTKWRTGFAWYILHF